MTEYKKIKPKGGQKVKSLITLLILLALGYQFVITGCSENGINSPQLSSGGNSEAGQVTDVAKYDSTMIRLDINFEFKSKLINNSRYLESNEGYRFNHIIEIDTELKPDEVLDLQELQPYGIFSLYLSATGSFILSNSDFSFSSKSIMLEKCEFIDLKLKNREQKPILVTGFIAGE